MNPVLGNWRCALPLANECPCSAGTPCLYITVPSSSTLVGCGNGAPRLSLMQNCVSGPHTEEGNGPGHDAGIHCCLQLPGAYWPLATGRGALQVLNLGMPVPVAGGNDYEGGGDKRRPTSSTWAFPDENSVRCNHAHGLLHGSPTQVPCLRSWFRVRIAPNRPRAPGTVRRLSPRKVHPEDGPTQ